MNYFKTVFSCVSVLMGVSVASFAFAGASVMSADSFVLKLDQNAASSSVAGSASIDAAQDQFLELERLFSAAPAATWDDVKGWRSGRCYFANAHTQARAALLVSVSENGGGGDGPLFPPHSINKVFPVISDQGFRADRFDELTSDIVSEVQSIVTQGSHEIEEVVFNPDSLYSKNDLGNLGFHIRKSQEYLLLKSSVLRDGGAYKAGDVFAYCYYFKKVRD